MLRGNLPSANLSLIKLVFFLPRRKVMQWFSFISGMTAGTFAGTVISALCHVAARSDGVEKREKTSKVNACVIRSDFKWILKTTPLPDILRLPFRGCSQGCDVVLQAQEPVPFGSCEKRACEVGYYIFFLNAFNELSPLLLSAVVAQSLPDFARRTPLTVPDNDLINHGRGIFLSAMCERYFVHLCLQKATRASIFAILLFPHFYF